MKVISFKISIFLLLMIFLSCKKEHCIEEVTPSKIRSIETNNLNSLLDSKYECIRIYTNHKGTSIDSSLYCKFLKFYSNGTIYEKENKVGTWNINREVILCGERYLLTFPNNNSFLHLTSYYRKCDTSLYFKRVVLRKENYKFQEIKNSDKILDF